MTRREIAPSFPGWLSDLVPFRRYTVPIGERRWHVMEHGPEDGRPVVLVHGNPTWGFLWRHVAIQSLLLDPTLRLIMPDLPGLGFSDRPSAKDHTLEHHGTWFAEWLEAMSLESAGLCIQDWGGAIGLLGFSRARVDVTGLVVLNTAIGPPRRDFRPTAFHRFSQMPVVSEFVFRGLNFPQSTMNIAQGSRRSITGLARAAYLYPLLRFGNSAPLALARMVPDTWAHPSIATLEECQEFFLSLDAPMRFVWGTKDPILGSVIRYLEKIRPEVPVTKTNAGHFLQEEVPDDIAAALSAVMGAA